MSIGPQILNFENSLSMSPRPQTAVLFRLAKFFLEALGMGILPLRVLEQIVTSNIFVTFDKQNSHQHFKHHVPCDVILCIK